MPALSLVLLLLLQLTAILLVTSHLSLVTPPCYPWLAAPVPETATIAARFPPPPGCRRVAVAPGSWGEWLRGLPLLPVGTPARLYNGQPKDWPEVVAAVVNIDVGHQDLQQCADAIIRLRAEYQFTHDPSQIHFHLTSGYDFRFADYAAGHTFQVRHDEVLPLAKPPETPDHAALSRYLPITFRYAGTLSLSRELTAVPFAQVQPGDVLIRGGSPGHAVLVIDVAEHPATHARYLLLAQSFMPAQNIHVLRNIFADEPTLRDGAWFAAPTPSASRFGTPEYSFTTQELKRF